MDANQLFTFANTFAFLSWIPLIVAPYNPRIRNSLFGISVVLLAALYTFLFAGFFDPSSMQSFSTLDGLMSLFSSKEAVLVGWVHYLAFDLLTGLYVAQNAQKNGLNPWIIRPLFLFVFMAGPVGFLLYTLVRTVAKRSYHFE